MQPPRFLGGLFDNHFRFWLWLRLWWINHRVQLAHEAVPIDHDKLVMSVGWPSRIRTRYIPGHLESGSTVASNRPELSRSRRPSQFKSFCRYSRRLRVAIFISYSNQSAKNNKNLTRWLSDYPYVNAAMMRVATVFGCRRAYQCCGRATEKAKRC